MVSTPNSKTPSPNYDIIVNTRIFRIGSELFYDTDCPSVGWSVGWSVRWSVFWSLCWSVRWSAIIWFFTSNASIEALSYFRKHKNFPLFGVKHPYDLVWPSVGPLVSLLVGRLLCHNLEFHSMLLSEHFLFPHNGYCYNETIMTMMSGM